MDHTFSDRYRLPPRKFDPDDLVINISPPNSPVLTPQSLKTTSPLLSTHADFNRFPRHRMRLLQEYGPSTFKFRGHDDFMDLEDDQVLVGDVYGYYEVSHWPGFEEQQKRTNRLLAQVKGEEYKESQSSSGNSFDDGNRDISLQVGPPHPDTDEQMLWGLHSDALTVEKDDDEESVFHHSPVKPAVSDSRANTPPLGQFTPAKSTQQRRKKTFNARNVAPKPQNSRNKSGISKRKKKTPAQAAPLRLPKDFLTSPSSHTKIIKTPYPASPKAPFQTQQPSTTSALSSINPGAPLFYTASDAPTTTSTAAPLLLHAPERPPSAAEQVLARLDQRFYEDIANGFVSPGSGRRYSKQERLQHAIQAGQEVERRESIQSGGSLSFGEDNIRAMEGIDAIAGKNAKIDPALLANDARQRLAENPTRTRGKKRRISIFDNDADAETAIEGANDEDSLINAPTKKKRKISQPQSATTKRSSATSTRRSSATTAKSAASSSSNTPQIPPQTNATQPTPAPISRNIFPRPSEPSTLNPEIWPSLPTTTLSLSEPYQVRILFRPDAPHSLPKQIKSHSATLSALFNDLEEAVTFYLLTKEEWRGKMWNDVQCQARRWVLWKMREEEERWVKMFAGLGVRFDLPGDIKSLNGRTTGGGGGSGLSRNDGPIGGSMIARSGRTQTQRPLNSTSVTTTTSNPGSSVTATAPFATINSDVSTPTPGTMAQMNQAINAATNTNHVPPPSSFITSASFHTRLRPLAFRHLASLLETIRFQTALPPPCRSSTGSTKHTRLYEANMRLAAMAWQIDFFERWIRKMGKMRVQSVLNGGYEQDIASDEGNNEQNLRLRYWTRTYPSMSVTERVDLLEGKKWAVWPGQKKSVEVHSRSDSAAFTEDRGRGHGHGRGRGRSHGRRGHDSNDDNLHGQNDNDNDSDSSEGTITRSIRKAREEAAASARVQAIIRPEFAWWQANKAQKEGGSISAGPGPGPEHQIQAGHDQPVERGRQQEDEQNASAARAQEIHHRLQLAGLPLVSTVNPDGSTPIDPTLFVLEAEQRRNQLPQLIPPRVVTGHGSGTGSGIVNGSPTMPARLNDNSPRAEMGMGMKQMTTKGELQKTPNGTATAVFSSSPVVVGPGSNHQARDNDDDDDDESGSVFEPDDSESEDMFFPGSSPPMPSPTIGAGPGRRGLRSARQMMSPMRYSESSPLRFSDTASLEEGMEDEDENETVVDDSTAHPTAFRVGGEHARGLARTGYTSPDQGHTAAAGYSLLDTELSPDSFNRMIAHQGHLPARPVALTETRAATAPAMATAMTSTSPPAIAIAGPSNFPPVPAYYTQTTGTDYYTTAPSPSFPHNPIFSAHDFGFSNPQHPQFSFTSPNVNNTFTTANDMNGIYDPFISTSTNPNPPPIPEIQPSIPEIDMLVNVNGDFAPLTLGETGETAMEAELRSAGDGFEGWRRGLFN